MARPSETFPPQEITDDVFDFLQQIHDDLAYDPTNRDALIDLISDFGKAKITDDDHVLAGVKSLLDGHPHLVPRFYGLIDPVRQGLDFLKRAKKALGETKYDQLVATLYSVDEEQSLDAHRVYREFKDVLGGKHDDLLRGLAEFLPKKYSPPPPPPPPSRPSAKAERDENRRRPERKHPFSYAAADAPESSSRPKKPRGVGVGVGPTPAPVYFADTSAAGCSRPSTSRTRKPRIEYEYDGSLPERNADAVADDSRSSRPIRAKKPRADDSESRHALIGGAGDANAGEVRRFREAWEFEIGYSLLDATLKRAEEAKEERDRLKGVPASLDELFPMPEIRGFLAKTYNGGWNQMRQLLEHGGDHTAFALEAIVKRLMTKDAEAVDEARRRQDPDRAAQRLHELALDRVRLERERVREINEANEQRRQP